MSCIIVRRSNISSSRVEVSMGLAGSGLGSTQNQPDPVGLQDSRLAADCEKPQVESNQA